MSADSSSTEDYDNDAAGTATSDSPVEPMRLQPCEEHLLEMFMPESLQETEVDANDRPTPPMNIEVLPSDNVETADGTAVFEYDDWLNEVLSESSPQSEPDTKEEDRPATPMDVEPVGVVDDTFGFQRSDDRDDSFESLFIPERSQQSDSDTVYDDGSATLMYSK